MAKAHVVKHFKKGALICRQGESASHLYILRRGKLSVRITPKVHEPTELQVRTKGQEIAIIDKLGTIAGEGGVFLNRRTASLVAAQDATEVEEIQIRTGGLKHVLMANTKLSMTLCRTLASRLRDLMERATDITDIVETLERHNDHFAVEFARLHGELSRMTKGEPMFKRVVADFQDSDFIKTGNLLLEHRHETSVFVNQMEAQRRTGNVTLRTGELLCQEGEIGRNLFVVRKGCLEVLAGSHIIGKITENEIVGEIAVLLKQSPKRCATVRAATSTSLSSISALEFEKSIEANPAVLIGIAHLLCKRLDHSNRFLGSHTVSTVEGLKNLSGNQNSCEEQLRAFAKALAPYESAASIASVAKRLAGDVAAACKALETE